MQRKNKIIQLFSLAIFIVFFAQLLLFIDKLHLTVFESTMGHFWLEIAGFLLATLAGCAAVKHFRSTESSFYLLIALAFFSNGFMDLVHAIAAVHVFGAPVVGQSVFISGTWTVGRVLLAGLLLLNVFLPERFVEKSSITGMLSAYFGPVMVAILGATTVTILYPLPAFILPNFPAFFHRPWEYFAAIPLLVALFFYFKLVKNRGIVGTCLMLSLIVGLISQIFMTTSLAIFDVYFTWSHLLKDVSYLLFCVSFFFRDPTCMLKENPYRFTVTRQLALVIITLVGIIAVFALFVIRSQSIIVVSQEQIMMQPGVDIQILQAEIIDKTTAMVRFSIFLLIVGVGGGLLHGLFAIRHIMTPLKYLTDVVIRISKGDLTAQIKGYHNNEIGDLAKAFERTVVSLKLAMLRNKERKEK